MKRCAEFRANPRVWQHGSDDRPPQPVCHETGVRLMKWISREKIKVDRVACPWLIKKFVDPDAEFVFLPHDTYWARVSNGIVFDVPD